MPRHKKTKVCVVGAGILCAGLFYGYVLIPLGVRIPCLFRRATGLSCPGCGITDLCLALLHGRLREAAACNWGVTLLSPWIAALGVYHVRGGRRRVESAAAAAMLAFLLGWTVYRNLRGI